MSAVPPRPGRHRLGDERHHPRARRRARRRRARLARRRASTRAGVEPGRADPARPGAGDRHGEHRRRRRLDQRGAAARWPRRQPSGRRPSRRSSTGSPWPRSSAAAVVALAAFVVRRFLPSDRFRAGRHRRSRRAAARADGRRRLSVRLTAHRRTRAVRLAAVPMRHECKHFESRTYANGETVRKCDLDLAPDAPWRCPDKCPMYERRLADVAWTHGSLVAPPDAARAGERRRRDGGGAARRGRGLPQLGRRPGAGRGRGRGRPRPPSGLAAALRSGLGGAHSTRS